MAPGGHPHSNSHGDDMFLAAQHFSHCLRRPRIPQKAATRPMPRGGCYGSGFLSATAGQGTPWLRCMTRCHCREILAPRLRITRSHTIEKLMNEVIGLISIEQHKAMRASDVSNKLIN